jgi:plastocyanin
MPLHGARARAIAGIAVAGAGLGGLALEGGMAGAAGTSGPTVTIKGTAAKYNYHFKPKSLTVKKGTTVTWVWNSDAPHNVTFEKLNGKHSGTKKKATGFHVTFPHKGTFSYSCTVHGFTAKVVVVKQ